MVTVYYDSDADLAVLSGKTIGMIGYGSQGHAHALNLKDNGQKVVVGLYPESKSRAVAPGPAQLALARNRSARSSPLERERVGIDQPPAFSELLGSEAAFAKSWHFDMR